MEFYMQAVVNLYSDSSIEIERFLKNYYKDSNFELTTNMKKWQKNFANPIEIADIIGAYAENLEEYNLSMWISIDSRCIY